MADIPRTDQRNTPKERAMAAMRDKFRFVVTDAAEAVVIHEALMSYRNREATMPADHLRAEAADRLLARLDHAVSELADMRVGESQAPAPYPPVFDDPVHGCSPKCLMCKAIEAEAAAR